LLDTQGHTYQEGARRAPLRTTNLDFAHTTHKKDGAMAPPGSSFARFLEWLLSSFAQRAHAAGADVQPLHFAVDHDVLLVHIWAEVTIRSSLREADVVSE
jgi:hypothetical protein